MRPISVPTLFGQYIHIQSVVVGAALCHIVYQDIRVWLPPTVHTRIRLAPIAGRNLTKQCCLYINTILSKYPKVLEFLLWILFLAEYKVLTFTNDRFNEKDSFLVRPRFHLVLTCVHTKTMMNTL